MLAHVALALSLLCPFNVAQNERPPAADVPLPASAFQATRAFLAQLDAKDKAGVWILLERLEAKRIEADKDHVERVRVRLDLRFATPDASACGATAAALAKLVKEEKTTLSITTRDVGAKGSPPTGVHWEIEYDPAKSEATRPPMQTDDKSVSNFETFLRKSAAHDRVEVGNLELEPLTPLTLPGGRLADGYAVRSKDADRALQRLRVTNFATVIEWNSRARVTALVLEPSVTPQIGYYRMRLEVFLLRPAQPVEKR